MDAVCAPGGLWKLKELRRCGSGFVTDQLRDRIAAVQHFHIPVDYAGYIECSCGVECKPKHGGIDVAEQLWDDHVADAVIEAVRKFYEDSLQSTAFSAIRLLEQHSTPRHFTQEADDD